MTALVKNKSRGSVVAQFDSAAYVAMAGLTSVDVSGEKSKTAETVTLDGPVYETKDPTGYATPPSLKLSGFYDPAHATYTNFAPLIGAPTTTNFKVTYTDGFGLGKKASPDKMLMADIEIEVSGAPS